MNVQRRHKGHDTGNEQANGGNRRRDAAYNDPDSIVEWIAKDRLDGGVD